jgi:hypothetical protein
MSADLLEAKLDLGAFTYISGLIREQRILNFN